MVRSVVSHDKDYVAFDHSHLLVNVVYVPYWFDLMVYLEVNDWLEF